MGCCGEAKTRLDIIKNACRHLHDGHRGVVALYDTIIEDLKRSGVTPEDIAPFLEVRELHVRMAEDSLKVAVLEDLS